MRLIKDLKSIVENIWFARLWSQMCDKKMCSCDFDVII